MAPSVFLQRLGGCLGLRSGRLTNDLRAAIEVQWGNQAWQVVYPGRASTPAPRKTSEVRVRLREAHAVAGTCSVVPGVALRVSRDLCEFNKAAQAWIEKDSHAVQYERDRYRNRRKMSCMETVFDAALDRSDDFNCDVREDDCDCWRSFCDCWTGFLEVCIRFCKGLCKIIGNLQASCNLMLCGLMMGLGLMGTMLTLAYLCAAAHPKDAWGAAGWSFAVLGLLLAMEFARWLCLVLVLMTGLKSDLVFHSAWVCFLYVLVPILALTCVVYAAVHYIYRGFWWTVFIHILSCCIQLFANAIAGVISYVGGPPGDGIMIAEACRELTYIQAAFARAQLQTAEALAREERHRAERAKLLTFEGNVLPRKDLPCVCSWPGKYEGAWEALVKSSRKGQTSAAVVFLPKDSERFGKHDTIPAGENLEGSCWCTPLYGEPKPWGCHWWSCWIANIEVAVQQGSRLQVFFFEGSLHQGKVESFATAGREHMERERIFLKKEEFFKSKAFGDSVAAGLEGLSSSRREDGSSQRSRELHRLFLAWLPDDERDFLEASEGLGNSQKAEVAWLELKGYEYEAVDVAKWMASKNADETRLYEAWILARNGTSSRMREADDAARPICIGLPRE